MTDRPTEPSVHQRIGRGALAAQTLSETLWEALRQELGGAHRQDRIAELSERLADISSALALLARVEDADLVPVEPDSEPDPGPGIASEPPPSSEAGRSPAASPISPAIAPAVTPPPAMTPATAPLATPVAQPVTVAHGSAVLVDERAQPDAHAQPDAEIEIRDERREHAMRERIVLDEQRADPWIASIERRLERYQRDRLPFSVLVVELADSERLRHAELPGEMARLTGLVETALAGQLRPADSLMRESPGRYWLLAPETDPAGARTLAQSMAAAVSRAAHHRGAPLEVAVGIASCPRDGERSSALAANADIALYAARAAGRPLA